MSKDENVNLACPMIHPESFIDDDTRQRAIKASERVIDNDIPDDKSLVEVADQAEEALATIDKRVPRPNNGYGMFPHFLPVRRRIANRRAVVSALNPESSAATTTALAISSVGKAALQEGSPVPTRLLEASRASLAGALAVGVAVSQPFGRIPGVDTGRHLVSKAAHRFF